MRAARGQVKSGKIATRSSYITLVLKYKLLNYGQKFRKSLAENVIATVKSARQNAIQPDGECCRFVAIIVKSSVRRLSCGACRRPGAKGFGGETLRIGHGPMFGIGHWGRSTE